MRNAIVLIIGFVLLSIFSFLKKPEVKNLTNLKRGIQKDNLTLCIIDRPGFRFSKNVKELLVSEIKKYGEREAIQVIEKQVQPPDQYKYFFPTKEVMDKWVDEIAAENCGTESGILKIIYAAFIEKDNDGYKTAFGYARLGKNTVVMLPNIEDTFLGPPEIEDALKEAAILHEIGHLWGLLHNEKQGCLMNRSFENITLGDNEFNKKISVEYKNMAPNLSQEEKLEQLMTKYGLTFCDYEIEQLVR